jgi:anti-anti-sigma regulatory factor
VLKITVSETATEDRWILQGRLVGPWVGELKKVWQNAHRGGKPPRCVFDLNDVTFMEKAGDKLLRVLAKQHVKFEASGIYVRGVLSQLLGKRTLS